MDTMKISNQQNRLDIFRGKKKNAEELSLLIRIYEITNTFEEIMSNL